MAEQKFRVDINLLQNKIRAALLDPIASDPSTPLEGQIWFNTTDNVFKYYDGSATHVLTSASSTATFTNKTFDANGTGNSISNIEVADLASGVLDTDLSSVSASDDTLASAKAIEARIQNQVSALSGGLAWKDDVIAATTAEITIASDLNVDDIVDGITLADGDRVLVKNQTTNPEENGIYIAGVTPARATDMDASSEFNTAIIPVLSGTANSGTFWRQTAIDPTVNTTAIAFAEFSAVVPDATTSLKGKVELATKAEADAQTSTTLAVTPAGLADFARSTSGSSTDNAITRYDGTSANIQDSNVTIDDNGSLNVPSGQSFKINGSSVLDATTLGSGVTGSSLTSVGTLASGNATAIVDAASTTAAGKAELSTKAEADAKASSTVVVTPSALADFVREYSATFTASTGQTITAATHGIATVTGVEIQENDGSGGYFAIGVQATWDSSQNMTWAINGTGINGRVVIRGV